MSERLYAVSATADGAADTGRAAKQAAQAVSAELRALAEEGAGVKEAVLRAERRQVRSGADGVAAFCIGPRAARARMQRQHGAERGEASEAASEQLARLAEQMGALGRAVQALADERPEVPHRTPRAVPPRKRRAKS